MSGIMDTTADIRRHIRHMRNRLQAVRERTDAYHPDCMRRWASDSLRDALTHIGHAGTYMTGGYDRTYCSALAPTVGEYRARYAADSLRSAQHNLVWAEHYAGLRSRESAAAADPFRSGRG